jgi:hypothetical protein
MRKYNVGGNLMKPSETTRTSRLPMVKVLGMEASPSMRGGRWE